MLLSWKRIEFLEKNWRKIAEEVKEIAKKYGNVYKVVVFGSVIKGKVCGSSDLDIAVIYDEKLSFKERRRREVGITLELPEEESLLVDIKVLDINEADFFLEFIGTYVEV
ncbi:MAG: nucleotidyltransferase domain-containing protein [Saccharolobus sp.]|uniref:nucleotidyltransferase domain-containing protein n=1 Tax=Saccharolobus sp. TaxID=2100761 RepID=UPI0028CF6F4E|nr:nucleotidyltransferase domain-containing protein [Saccharolobus sp.]MDT7861888.1 nucleotidyltransferase domain-containing protein [Saccharolobus sp.]